jgi:hypothetical protein
MFVPGSPASKSRARPEKDGVWTCNAGCGIAGDAMLAHWKAKVR